MDDLTSLLSSSFSVQSNPYCSTSSQHPRFSDYKAKECKSSQEHRRVQFLELRKKKRDNIHDHVRRLVHNDWSDMLSDDEEEGEGEAAGEGNDMDTEVAADVRRTYTPKRDYKDQLMLSEWLVDVPSDLEEQWIMVLSPVGKRCLVVAADGWTKSYGKNGFRINKFTSQLCGGNYSDRGTTILDCIYCELDKTYYIIDCMCWNTLPVYDCETEFRFFWLQSKIDEVSAESLGTISADNPYKFVMLPRYGCELAIMETAMKESINLTFQMDGVLFYHKRTHYTFGCTPLVGWLKPYMLPEMLGVPVPAPVWDSRPDMEWRGKVKGKVKAWRKAVVARIWARWKIRRTRRQR